MSIDFLRKNIVDFDGLMIKLASPEEIKSWSHGEVVKPETINYRTWRPEKDGLFCERIFGTSRDNECYCGKYKGIRFKGVICDKCGVEVTLSKVRRERMGHISLAIPAVHIWFLKNQPSPLSLLLRMPQKEIESVVYFARYLVIKIDKDKLSLAMDSLKSGIKKEIIRAKEEAVKERSRLKEQLNKEKSKLAEKIKSHDQLALARNELSVKYGQKAQWVKENYLLEKNRFKELERELTSKARSLDVFETVSEQEYYHLSRFGAANFFEVKMGAEAILTALSNIDLEKTLKVLRQDMKKTTSKTKKNKIIQRIRIVDGMLRSGVNPTWMVLKAVPVIPPELRPMVQLTGGRFATADLNDLYRRVINRNNRLKRLMSLGAPEVILRNEKRMLQEAVDTLIDASKSKVRLMRRRTPPRSLSDLLRGKKGRFRKNLLGKRVDYSGRSAIVVGPNLKLNQCGLPKEIALEIFRPFILRELIVNGSAPNIRNAKGLLDRRIPEVYDILEEVIKGKLILINRAPTLHKLSMQAFYPVLVDGLAIQLHPCVCSGFNADFDGDQMGVFLPLSKKAQKEAKNKVISSKNLLKTSDGMPTNVPNKEMAVGCYYATSIKQEDLPLWKEHEEKKVLPKTVKYFANSQEAVSAYRVGKVGLRDLIVVRLSEGLTLTTIGRVMFNQLLPDFIDFVNKSISSKIVKQVLADVFHVCSRKDYVKLVDKIKDFGFWGMSISGLSLAITDCGFLPSKDKVIHQADEKVAAIRANYDEGLITNEEKERLSRDVWLETTDKIAEMTWNLLEKDSPIKIFSNAGASRISQDQIKQVSGMRGLVVDPMGRIIPLPTKSSFRQGLSVFEYITGARGSRKGLTDTALKTADAGYLTRKLVDVSHSCLVREKDCGTRSGLLVKRKGERADSFYSRIFSRVVATTVKDKKGKVLVKRGEVIDEEKIDLIRKANVEEVLVRSPFYCQTKAGVCSLCYGWDLSRHKMVEVGVPVGVIAAQSIGEPGTQLTLRTKHVGGVVGLDVTQGLPRVQELFEMRRPKLVSFLADIDGKITVKKNKDEVVIVIKGKEGRKFTQKEYVLPKNSPLLVSSGQEVKKGDQLAVGSVDIKQLMELKGLEMAKQHLLDEIQKVYESQGITVNDKHIEVVIHEMSSRVKIISPGDTTFLIGSYVDEITFEEENKRAKKEKGKPARSTKIILGITRASLNTSSWLSAASFQTTTNILTEAAILGRKDKLIGMKENVIIGGLIPVTKERAKL